MRALRSALIVLCLTGGSVFAAADGYRYLCTVSVNGKSAENIYVDADNDSRAKALVIEMIKSEQPSAAVRILSCSRR